ncbi:Rv3235 family protein [Ruania halotolerans]|uniref:Rv3235 family protein n=1 Tax=Ruania halotolerans TaxID=2897773 RepID=UPI001E4FBC03|nr:Rv3235 family protein [Ruania halotolerans]UFU07600.1 Rv3235 family protein [Ruania halotolerans]
MSTPALDYTTARAHPHAAPAVPEDRWDRLRFDATAAEHPPGPENEAPAPRLVWSNGRTSERPDAAEWAGVIVRASAEALLGMRPVAQLSRWLDPTVWTALNRRAALGIQIAGRPRRPRAVAIKRVHSCEVTDGIWECSVVLHDGARVRAAAVRLEAHRGRWRTTAVRIG